MSGHGEKLTRKQEMAIAALLTAPTVTDAAKAAGVSEATLARWQSDPVFAEVYRAARRQVLTQATSRLSQACSDAVDTLKTIMEDEDAPASSRVTAARAILDYSYKALELEELDARVAVIEQALTHEEALKQLA